MEVATDAKLTATDRFPPPTAMTVLRTAAAEHGTRVLLSLGGNARTNGFPIVAGDKTLRRKLVRNLVHFCQACIQELTLNSIPCTISPKP
jgi:GH18 family chitinase